jgi:hypothetical protein
VNLHVLPANLPAPAQDGACDHLPGATLPTLVLDSSQGPVDLGEPAAGLAVLYVYPRTGRPDRPVPAGRDATPGARGCTPHPVFPPDLNAAEVVAWLRKEGVA